MGDVSRRSFIATSAGALALVSDPLVAFACSESTAAGFSSRLNVAQSTRRNLRAFVENRDALGLAGLVSMTTAKGELGSYAADALFLFPWTKPQAPGILPTAYLPVAAEQSATSTPFTPAGVALDEQFCRYVLQAPPENFIGFVVDTPIVDYLAHYPWFANVDLPGGERVGIQWTSGNLNPPWFAGSTWIPPETSFGAYWRRRIIDGLREAASPIA